MTKIKLSKNTAVKLLLITLVLVLLGFTANYVVKQNKTMKKLCELTEISFTETGDLAGAWYGDAGIALTMCGKEDRTLEGAYRECLAYRRDGYVQDCDKEEAQAYPMLTQHK